MASEATFKVEYAKTDKSSCKNKSCASKHIDKGSLRIGKVTPSDRFEEGGLQMNWYHPPCIFETFARMRGTSRKVERPADLEGFDALAPEDQSLLRRLIADALPTYGKGGKKPAKKTAKAAAAAADAVLPIAPFFAPPATKKQKKRLALKLTGEDGRVVTLRGAGPHVVGRGDVSGVADRRCSRRQVELTLRDVDDDAAAATATVVVRSVGVNIGCLYRSEEPPIAMKQGVEYRAASGDQFTLLADRFPFVIHVVDDDDDAAAPPPAKRAKEEEGVANEGSTAVDEPAAAAAAVSASDDDEEDPRPMCKYGMSCYRKNADHFLEFRHPPGHPLGRS